jgi:hypothetical protein
MTMERPWYAYLAANDNTKELYPGVAVDRGTLSDPAGFRTSVHNRWEKGHCVGKTGATSHWDCHKQDVRIIKGWRFASQERASAFAHAIARDRRLLANSSFRAKLRLRRGYRILRTTGV